MILIQTAIRQEFSAIARTLVDVRYSQGVTSSPAGLSAKRAVTARGRLQDRDCILLLTGIGQAAAGRRLRSQLGAMQGNLPSVILSIGLAGGLINDLRIGDSVIASMVKEIRCNELVGTCAMTMPVGSGWHCGNLLSLDQAAMTPERKRELAANYDGVICDMETAAVAAAASESGIPCIGARIVSDTVGEALPMWLIRMSSHLTEGRTMRAAAMIASHPQDLVRLVRLALRMRKLDRSLRDLARRVVGSGIELE